jgi:hypothetical protein
MSKKTDKLNKIGKIVFKKLFFILNKIHRIYLLKKKFEAL